MTLETSLSDYNALFSSFRYCGSFDPAHEYSYGDVIIDEHGITNVYVGNKFEPIDIESERPHQFEPMSCPNCGGTIKYDERTHTARCEYCNTLFT